MSLGLNASKSWQPIETFADKAKHYAPAQRGARIRDIARFSSVDYFEIETRL
jgi:hypothetical protein